MWQSSTRMKYLSALPIMGKIHLRKLEVVHYNQEYSGKSLCLPNAALNESENVPVCSWCVCRVAQTL
jgi:hypothetical protein